MGAHGRQRSRLQHHRAAGDERRRCLPHWNREREVPGSNQRDGPDGLPQRHGERLRGLARQRLSMRAETFARVELEQVEPLHHFAARLGHRLALFTAEGLRDEVDLRFQDGVRAREDAPAFRAGRARPSRERLRRGIDRSLRIVGAALRPQPEHVARVRGIRAGLVLPRERRPPFAADQVAAPLVRTWDLHGCLTVMKVRSLPLRTQPNQPE